MSPARLTVRAIVVTDGRSERLPDVLDAIAHHDPRPDHVHVVLTDDAAPPAPVDGLRVAISSVSAMTFSAAVDTVLVDEPAESNEYVWLLHDDAAPEPGALAALTATARKRSRAALLGAAQVRWDNPRRLVALGSTVTVSGTRRLTLVDDSDIDQGQYASRDDVLAVSMAGALVSRGVWEQLGGLDPAYRGWSDSVDFSRRVWRSGHDVVIVPSARVRHRQESLAGIRQGLVHGRTATYGMRRTAEWYHAAAYASWWAVLPVLLWSVLASVGRAALRIVHQSPRLFMAELSVPFRLAALLPRLPASRRRVRAAGPHARAERELLASTRMALAHARVRDWGGREQWRAANVPSEMVRAELTRATRRRRWALAGLVVAMTTVSIAAYGPWLPAVRGSRMLAGDVIGITDVSRAELWDRALTGWTEQGFGGGATDSGWAGLMLLLSSVPGGVATSVALVLALAPLWAALSAWFAVGAWTRWLPARAVAAAAYGVAPWFIAAVEQGRLAAVIVHVCVPVAVVALTRAGGWHCGEPLGDGSEFPVVREPSANAAAVSGVVLGVIVAAVPALVLIVVPLVLLLGLVAAHARWRVWAALVPPVVVAAPALLAAAGAGGGDQLWRMLWREPGPSAGSQQRGATDLIVDPVVIGSTVWPWDSAPTAMGLMVVVLAGLGAVVTRRWAVATVAIVAGTAGLVIAIVAQGASLAPDAGVGSVQASGWAGYGMSVAAAAGLVLVGVAASHRKGLSLAGRSVRVLVVAAAAMVVAAQVTLVTWPGRLDDAEETVVVLTDRDVLPLVAAMEQTGPAQTRVAVVADAGDVVEVTVTAADGSEVITDASTVDASVAASGMGAILADVATLAGGGETDLTALATWGAGVVVATPGSDDLEAALAQSPALTLMGASERGSAWRVNADAGSSDDDAPIARAVFRSDGGDAEVVAMGRSSGASALSEPGTVTMAVPADSRWQATVDGAPVGAITDEQGRQAFRVEQPGHFQVSWDDGSVRTWWWATVAVFAIWVLAAVPLTSRRLSREVA